MFIHLAKYTFILKLILIGFLITSCSTKPKIDIENVEINYQFLRFEQDLFDPNKDMDIKVRELENKYGVFFTRFIENIINAGTNGDDQVTNNLKNFVYDSDIQTIYKKVNEKYTDLSVESLELENALKRYHVALPKKVVPSVTTFISGFSYTIAVTDSTLGIGLDMYMGNDFAFYDMLRFPQFKKNRLARKYLVKDALMGWLQSEFLKSENEKTFLSQIIYQGKLLYVIEQLLPDAKPQDLIGYDDNQWKWCRTNEEPMWAHFISNKLFYSSLFSEYHKYINEGPFTPGFDRESPDQTGYYVGWQIVKSYMSNNPNTSIEELLMLDDSKTLLSKSGYKPLK